MRPILLLACTAVLAHAQSPAKPISPVVITATRVETPVSAPVSVSVLEGDSLRARGITYLADALRLVPGLNVVVASSFGSQASLFVRGGQGNFVRVLLDGVPLNEPGGAVDLASLTLENIERVEVVRGPASVLYGEDAVTGVIQMVSRRGGGAPHAALSLDGGSYGQRDAVASGSAAGARASVSASVADRAVSGILPFNNASRNRAGSMTLHVFPDARTDATLTARWQAATYHYPTESGGAIADRNAEDTSHRLLLSLAGTQLLTSRVTAAWSAVSSEHDPRSNDGPDSPADTLGYYGFFSRGTVTRRSADLRLSARVGATQLLTLGAEASRDHERSSTRSLSQYGSDTGDFTAARNDRAMYLQAVGAVHGRGSYQLGARLDDNSAFGTFRTVRAAAAWQLSPSWRVRAAAGTAFRAPSFFENFATGYVRGNAALAPERTRSRELGIERVAPGLTFGITAYAQRFRDLIQYSGTTATPTSPNYFNVAGANADGIEAEASFALPASAHGRVMYSWTHTRVTDAGFDTGAGALFVLGSSLVRRPAHAGRLELGRTMARRVDVVVGAAYTGRAEDRDFSAWPAVPVVLPAHTLVDLAATVRLSGAGARVPLQARVRGDNLTNVDYQGIYGFRAPGRSLRVGLTVGTP